MVKTSKKRKKIAKYAKRYAAKRNPLAAKHYQEIYQSSTWKNLRKEYFVENPYCEHCNKKESKVLDHIIPLAIYEGDPFNTDNTQALCRSCDMKKQWDDRRKNFTTTAVYENMI